MGTKINQDYYGDSAQWVSVRGVGIEGNVKTSNRNIYRLCEGGYYQGGDFDLTASPWGIGESSLSSDFYCYALSDNGRLSIQKYFNKKGNTPLFLYRNGSGTTGMNLRGSSLTTESVFRYECTGRVFPAADVTGSETIKSTLTLDADTNVNNAGCAAAIPITYYNYNKARLLCDVFWYRNSSDNLQTVRNAALIDLIINPQNYENIAEVYGITLEGRFVYGTQGQVPQYGYWNDFCPSIGGTAREIPDFIKKTYYGDTYDKWTRPQRKLMTIGYWELSHNYATTQIQYGGGRPNDLSLYRTPSIPSTYKSHDCFYGQFSEKHQVFDDVSYHWEFKYAWATLPSTTPIYLNDGDIIPPNGYYMPYCTLVIDDTTYNTTAESYFYALIHEAAFMGFPVIANRYDSTYDIPTNWIFLPVFDEHMITTGDFKRGTASLDLPNATWGDIFDDNMPVYNPEYQPEQPNLWILPQRPLIHVYGEKTTNFNTNGYAIIEPISCEVYHEENGEYSAQFETYCDEYGKFTYLHKQAQVKIPIRYHGEVSWQIFRVMNTHRIMNADGTYRIRALAYHKFYDNNNFLIKSAHPTGMSGITALPYICTHSLYNSQIYPFEASSDIAAGKTAYYDNMSITNALLGADQCFVNRWGGKLYRDNLHFSINDEMEHSKSAGVISYAYNLTDIDFEEDDTELITDLIAEDNFGNSYHIGVPDSDLRVPNRIYAYRSFYYDEEDVQAFHADAAAYLDEYKQSVVNITVNFLNLSELDKYKEFQQLDAYEVGDRVIIYHKDLDIYYSHLEIISKRYDVVKRRTVEIQIGDFKNAITQRAYMSDTTSDGQTAQDKMNAQLFAQDTKIMSVSISGMETFDIFALEKRTINELEGR